MARGVVAGSCGGAGQIERLTARGVCRALPLGALGIAVACIVLAVNRTVGAVITVDFTRAILPAATAGVCLVLGLRFWWQPLSQGHAHWWSAVLAGVVLLQALAETYVDPQAHIGLAAVVVAMGCVLLWKRGFMRLMAIVKQDLTWARPCSACSG
jgi:hypothetical protein